MLLPAAAAWITAWLVVAAPDAGLDPYAIVWGIWVTGAVVLVAVGGALWSARCRSGRRRGAVSRWLVLLAPSGVVILAASGLVASTAAIALGQRDDSPLAALAEAHRSVEVVVDVAAAPRVMRAPIWGEASASPTLRIEARLVMVDGLGAGPVAVTAMVSV